MWFRKLSINRLLYTYSARLLQWGFYFIIIKLYALTFRLSVHILTCLEPAIIMRGCVCMYVTRKTISLYFNNNINYNRLMTDLLNLYRNILQFVILKIDINLYTSSQVIYNTNAVMQCIVAVILIIHGCAYQFYITPCVFNVHVCIIFIRSCLSMYACMVLNDFWLNARIVRLYHAMNC